MPLLLLVQVPLFENHCTGDAHLFSQRRCAFMRGRFCKTARVRQLGRTGSYELSVGITRPKSTASRVILPHCLLLSLFLHQSLHFRASLSLSPHHPCSLLSSARSCSLQVASQQLCTRKLIHLHHPVSEWQAGERRRLQKNRLSSPLTGSLLTVRTQPIIPCSGE